MNPSVHSYYDFTQADFKAINALPSGVFFPQVENDAAWYRAPYVLVEGTPSKPSPGVLPLKPENTTTKCLPLMNVGIEMDVVSTISKTTLTQTYLNQSDKPIKEARYSFPLYEGAVVCSFSCTFGDGRVLEGEVKPKETAKAEFEQARATYTTTGLLEEHTSEIFEIHLGNIPAETTLKIEIEYFNELKADTSSEGLLVTIPTAIAPRYGPQPAEFSLKKEFQESGLGITVNVLCNERVRGLKCLSHPISVEIGTQNRKVSSFGALAEEAYNPKKAKASLIGPTAKLDKDFVLMIIPASATVLSSQAVVEVNDKDPNFAAMMITIYPKQLFPSVSLGENHDEIIFVTDRSASMIDKIETLKQAMFVFLRSLPEQCRFNIYSFGSTFASLWSNSQVYSQATLEQATKYVRKMQADMGGTEILEPVRSAFENRNKGDSNTQIIILTDGEVFNTKDTIDFVHQARSDSKETVRFFALGIGHQASHELVEGIARNGGGYAEVVAIDGRGKWQERVIQMLKAALMPSSWKLMVDSALGSSTEGEQSNSVNGVIQAPKEAPSAHPFSRRSIYLLYDLGNAELPEKIVVTGSTPDGRSVKATLDVEKTNLDLSLITLLAVKQRIKDLEESSELGARDEAERLGMQWKVTGKYTSFIILDRSDGSRKELYSYRPKRSELAGLLGARHSGRCSFGDVPSFGARHSGRCSFGDVPSFGNVSSIGHVPAFGNAPTFGDIPSFGNVSSIDHVPAFGNAPTLGDVPSFGNVSSIGHVPAFGNAPTLGDVPSFGNVSSIGHVPAFGNAPTLGDVPTFGVVPFGYRPSFRDIQSSSHQVSYPIPELHCRLQTEDYLNTSASVLKFLVLTNTATTIQDLLALQSFDGSFPQLSTLFPFLAHFHMFLIHVYSTRLLFKAVPSTKVHATILAVHMMQTIFYAHKSLWELCRQKAITWLREQVKSWVILYFEPGQFNDSECSQRYHDLRSYERWMKPEFEKNMRVIEVYSSNDQPQSNLLDGVRLDDDDNDDVDMEDVAHAASQGKVEQVQNTATQ